MSPDAAEIHDDDCILRRIPFDWVDPGTRTINNILAFLPTQTDGDGLSVDLASMSTPEATAARGVPGKRYFVARLRISELKQLAPDLHRRRYIPHRLHRRCPPPALAELT